MLWLALGFVPAWQEHLCVRLLLGSTCSYLWAERADTPVHLSLAVCFLECGKSGRTAEGTATPCLSKCQVLNKQETTPSYTLPTKQTPGCDDDVQTRPRNPGVCVSDR